MIPFTGFYQDEITPKQKTKKQTTNESIEILRNEKDKIKFENNE